MRKVSDSDARVELTVGGKPALSRRLVLGAAAALGVGAACGMSAPASAQSKQKPTDVGYQASPKDGNQCDKCALFQPPDGCQGVEGKISPSGWCQLFSPKA